MLVATFQLMIYRLMSWCVDMHRNCVLFFSLPYRFKIFISDNIFLGFFLPRYRSPPHIPTIYYKAALMFQQRSIFYKNFISASPTKMKMKRYKNFVSKTRSSVELSHFLIVPSGLVSNYYYYIIWILLWNHPFVPSFNKITIFHERHQIKCCKYTSICNGNWWLATEPGRNKLHWHKVYLWHI